MKKIILLSLLSASLFAQNTTSTPKSDFWQKVQFGGGIGLDFGNNYTNVALSPSGIYNVNEYLSLGAGLQGSYVDVKNNYNSLMYGAKIIGLFNPVQEIQLSTELEELNINRTYNAVFNQPSDHYWNTALYIGAGYKTNGITVGAKYNLLYDKIKSPYNSAIMPFVSIYF